MQTGILAAKLAAKLEAYQSRRRLLVAYSGGADSHALLHALVQLAPAQPIVALHVNHGLSPNADDWQLHCQRQAQALGVEFVSERVRVVNEGLGIEGAARQARYSVFARHVDEDDLLLMAHHADDQIETFFLRTMRGAGVRGLGGMPETRAIGHGMLLRPWLEQSRQSLREYAQAQQLTWIEDESNSDLQYDRNYLREQLLPILEARWPHARQSIVRSMSWCGEADAVADELAEIDYFACYPHAERVGYSMSFHYLTGLSRARVRNVLRLWMTKCGVPLPGYSRLDVIIDQLLSARIDASPQVGWGGWQCRRYQSRLYLIPEMADCHSDTRLVIHPSETLSLDCFGELSFVLVSGQGFRVNEAQPLEVRFDYAGVRCRPQGRAHSQQLKKLFQEHQVPPWLRERTPLIYQGDALLAVGDWWICDEAVIDCDEMGYLPMWNPPYAEIY